MQEKEKGIPDIKEQYSKLSLFKRKKEYQRLWKALPQDAFRDYRQAKEMCNLDPVLRPSDFDPEFASKIIESGVSGTLQRREHSEYLKTLTDKLETLVSFAPITQSFQKYIIEGYKLYGKLGVDKDEELPDGLDNLLWTFDTENSEKAGIFDPERGKELERIGYRKKSKSYFWIEKMLEDNFDKTYGEGELEKAKSRIGESEDQKILKRWRQEFVEKYHDEP